VVTGSDSGQQAVDRSDILGPLTGEALANPYYPDGNRGVGDTFIRYASDVGGSYATRLRSRPIPAGPRPHATLAESAASHSVYYLVMVG